LIWTKTYTCNDFQFLFYTITLKPRSSYIGHFVTEKRKTKIYLSFGSEENKQDQHFCILSYLLEFFEFLKGGNLTITYKTKYTRICTTAMSFIKREPAPNKALYL